MQVVAEVRTAARGVESSFKRVQSTQAARVLPAQRLDAEEKKFAAGMSTNFLVTQAQRDLAEAEVDNLRAVADYRKSVINFERVQEAGVSGTGAIAILSTGAANTNQAGSGAALGGGGAVAGRLSWGVLRRAPALQRTVIQRHWTGDATRLTAVRGFSDEGSAPSSGCLR